MNQWQRGDHGPQKMATFQILATSYENQSLLAQSLKHFDVQRWE